MMYIFSKICKKNLHNFSGQKLNNESKFIAVIQQKKMKDEELPKNYSSYKINASFHKNQTLIIVLILISLHDIQK